MKLVKKQSDFIRWMVLFNHSKLPVDIRSRLYDILDNNSYDNLTSDRNMLNQLRGEYFKEYKAFFNLK